jgi:hypothetical protein
MHHTGRSLVHSETPCTQDDIVKDLVKVKVKVC